MKRFTLLISFLFISTVALSQDVLMQNGTINQCSGTFLDSGGAGNYGSNESFTLTICPDVPGNMVQLNFTQFSTQTNSDVMMIYNSTMADAAVILGTYSGGGAANNPGFVTATPVANPSGCLTIVFTSDASATTTGWEAAISCSEPCQDITAQIDSTTPAISADGSIKVCQGDDITFNGGGTFSVDPTGATYEWDFGDGTTGTGQTVTHNYPNEGVYLVNLTITDDNTSNAPTMCSSTNFIDQIVQVGTDPSFLLQAANSTLCFGESTDIIGGVMPTEFIFDCTPASGSQTALPDGSGVSYASSAIVENCYADTEVIVSGNQVASVCLNIEHSYAGDLDIFLTSPNGVQVQLFAQAGGGTYMGGADNNDNGVPGVGADYCFSTTGATILANAPTITAGSNPPNASYTPGTYLPIGNFDDFIGSPINGDWIITITDNIFADDGTIFFWSIEFDPALQPPLLSFTPVTVTEGWDPDPTITNTVGNTITVAPPAAGQYCYTYRTTDDFGCEYTEQVCIDVLPEIITAAPDNLFLCNPGAPPYIFDLTQNDAVVTAAAPNPGDLNISYYETQMDADNETNPIPNPNAYSSSAILGTPQTIFIRVEYLTSDCYETESFTLNITSQPTIDPVMDMELCDDASNDDTEPFDLESQSATILGGQSATDYTVTYHLTLAEATAGTGALVSLYNNIANPQPIFVRVQLNNDASCFNVTTDPLGEFDLIVNERDDSSFTATPTCGGGTIVITGDAGGMFAFNPLPGDGATIDANTGTIANGSSGATYTVEYTTAGICPSTTTQDVTVITTDDSTFTMLPTCDGGTVDTVVTPGGAYTFNPAPTDAAVIDPATGTVTGGTSGATYTVEYTTTGACSATSSFSLTVITTDDSTFTMIPTCDGGTVDSVVTPGGTYVFNPLPTDAAIIDATTGTITNGTSGASYTIDYTTNGTCPSTSSFTVTVNITNDASFTMLPACDGGTVDSVVTPGGVYAFNPLPTDT
uniref:PKD domain-containing protein n=1 Tax=uncultured Lacinutrix sp. TaxID=574032 RepID=UPI00262189E5